MLTQRVPYPPDRGDRIRSYHLLKFLAARAEVHLACTTTEPVTEETKAALRQHCTNFEIGPVSKLSRAMRSARSLASGRSATEGYFWSPQLASTVKTWALNNDFDAVLCYCSSMFRYTQLPELAAARLVVDLVDVDSQKWSHCAAHTTSPKRWLYQLESRRVEQLERRISTKADAMTVVSDVERKLLQSIAPAAPVSVVNNGVDLEYFVSNGATEPEPHTCCFIGVLNYAPNVDGLQWFCANVWPAVRAAVPDARFLVVGKSPNQAVRALAALPGIELHADVPDVRPFLERSSVAISPLRYARGVQNKVLEAMAMGKAVVVSPESLEGIRARVGVDLLAAASSSEWLAALTSLFANRKQVSHLGWNAREHAELAHSWETCLIDLLPAIRPTNVSAEKWRSADDIDSSAGVESSGATVA